MTEYNEMCEEEFEEYLEPNQQADIDPDDYRADQLDFAYITYEAQRNAGMSHEEVSGMLAGMPVESYKKEYES